MGTQKHRNLTVDTLSVRELTVNGQPFDGTPVPAPEEPANSTPVPVAPYPLPLPEKLTMVAIAARQDHLLAALVEAGIIAPPQERPTAPEDAPQTVEVQTPVLKAESPAELTPQAISAGVVDGA